MAKPPQSELVQIKLRIKDELRAALQTAADAKQTSVNAEIVDRLQRSLERDASVAEVFDSPVTAAIAKMIAAAMQDAGKTAGFTSTFTIDGAIDWLKNPYAFDQAIKAANRILEALRPHGQMKLAGGEAKLAGGETPRREFKDQIPDLGVRFADAILKEAGTGESVSPNTRHRAESLHRELDALSDRIMKGFTQANTKNARKGKGR